MNDKEIKEMQQIDATIAKLNAETAKISKETVWYPVVITSGIFTVIFAITKYILS